MSSDCIPKADFGSISTFPIEAKGPIIGLAVVLSVVGAAAIVVIVLLVRKLQQLKKVGGDLGAKLNASVGSVGGEIAGGIKGAKDKLPDVKLDIDKSLNIGIDAEGAAALGYDSALKLKGAIQGGIEFDIGLDVNNPFFNIFNALPYASVLVDTKGVIVRANAAAKLKWGYPTGELDGKLYKILVSPKELEVRLGQIEALIRGEKPSFELDSFDVKIDGAQIEVEVYGSLLNILGKLYVFIITGHVCFTAKGDRYKEN